MEKVIDPRKPHHDILAWALALAPLPLCLASDENVNKFLVVYWIILIGCTIGDKINLKNSGYRPPSFFASILLPVIYLWQRCNVTGSKKILPLVWVIAAASPFIADYLSRDTLTADAACPIVTRIISERLGSNSSKCMKVKITEKVTKGFYKASATLDNGNDIDITIEEKGDDQIYVRIPPQYLVR